MTTYLAFAATDNEAQLGTLTGKRLRLLQSIKRCIWLYFWLLIFEGALRKWALPMLANPILLVRDPVVLWIYIQAFRAGLFPRNLFLLVGGLLAWASLLAGLVAIQGNWMVVAYGFRTNFLHLPLLFVMQNLLSKADVRKIGQWVLFLAIPMTLLMAVQFKSPSGAWINAGSDEAFKQIDTAGGHIRAPGTFSFISGPIYFYAIAAAFLMESLFLGRAYPKWLTLAAGLSVTLGPFVSGSRSLIGNIMLVLVCAAVTGTLLQPRLLLRTIQAVCSLFVISVVLLQLPIFQEGVSVLSERFGSGADVQQGFLVRALGETSITPEMWYDPPLLGSGLGTGTNVGAMLNVGTRTGFEGEFGRVTGESGPVLGLAFIFFRFFLLLWLFGCAIRAALRGNILPFLLAGACGTVMLNGQWGQATTLGFAVFGSGLCLAAINETHPEMTVKPGES